MHEDSSRGTTRSHRWVKRLIVSLVGIGVVALFSMMIYTHYFNAGANERAVQESKALRAKHPTIVWRLSNFLGPLHINPARPAPALIGSPIAATGGQLSSSSFLILGTGDSSTNVQLAVKAYFPIRITMGHVGYTFLVPASMVVATSAVKAPELIMKNPVIVRDPYDSTCIAQGFLTATIDCSNSGYDSVVNYDSVASYNYLTSNNQPNIGAFLAGRSVYSIIQSYTKEVEAPPKDIPLG